MAQSLIQLSQQVVRQTPQLHATLKPHVVYLLGSRHYRVADLLRKEGWKVAEYSPLLPSVLSSRDEALQLLKRKATVEHTLLLKVAAEGILIEEAALYLMLECHSSAELTLLNRRVVDSLSIKEIPNIIKRFQKGASYRQFFVERIQNIARQSRKGDT